MDIERLKEYILENDLIPTILEELGCHHIRHRDGYYQCANPDGDNATAVCVYENDGLTTVNYTREIGNGKTATDLINLVEFYHNESFPYAVKWISECIGLDYYHNFDEDIPESLLITRTIMDLQSDNEISNDEKPLIPIPECIVSYYKPFVNKMFYEDGVSYTTQKEFEIGYDESSDRITIPIRDEIGNLVGIKARYFYREIPDNIMKFIYIEKCARSQILYGLNRALPYINTQKSVFVAEAEKGVMQLVSAGYDNAIATGGKKISQSQINKMTRLCVPIIFVFDKDVQEDEIYEIADRFIDCVEIYAVIDNIGILDEKESPTDNIMKFERLLSECKIRIK